LICVFIMTTQKKTNSHSNDHSLILTYPHQVPVPMNYFQNKFRPEKYTLKHVRASRNSDEAKKSIGEFYDSGKRGLDLTFKETHIVHGFLSLWSMHNRERKFRCTINQLYRAMGFNAKPNKREKKKIEKTLCGLTNKKFPIIWKNQAGGYSCDFNTVIQIHDVSKDASKPIEVDDVNFNDLHISLHYGLFPRGQRYCYINPRVCMEIREHKDNPSKFDVRFYEWLANEWTYRIARNYKVLAETALLLPVKEISKRQKHYRDRIIKIYDLHKAMGYLNSYELDNKNGTRPADILRKNPNKFYQQRQ